MSQEEHDLEMRSRRVIEANELVDLAKELRARSYRLTGFAVGILVADLLGLAWLIREAGCR